MNLPKQSGILESQMKRSTISQARTFFGFLSPLILISLFPVSISFAQGCGMGGHGGHGGHGGGRSASHERASADSDVMPVWNSILFSHAGLDRAVTAMSAPDALYYGGLLRDDFKSLKTSARDMSLGMGGQLASANDRIKQLTKQIPRDLKANNQAAAFTTLEYLDIELERVIALFPSTTFPTDFASKFRASDSSGTDPMDEPAETAAPTAATYACPMHPDVTATQPGNCPKCGMALEKI